MHEILTDERRAAIEVIIEERTGYRDPEDRDGDLRALDVGRNTERQNDLGGRCDTPAQAHRESIEPKGAARMTRTSSSFYRGMVAGVMAWAVVCGLGALLAGVAASVPSYIRLAGIINVTVGVPALSILYWWEQRRSRLPA